ncbi:hypothetical protein YH63_002060 [Afipia massiliensis]|uniref:Threonine transporter n=2 Tax=Afipia massiliensis TaxID=211460 RepID=A0A4U6BX78_9BRAD|nr:hypothetical protein YH63_002060 [Afipia massiliensis]
MERLFNTPLECGLRLLYLLNASKPKKLDLQRLITYDYLLVHSGDVDGSLGSLHPAVPFRGSEWLVKRDIVRDALDLMFARELVDKRLEAKGIFYAASPLTANFIALLKSGYAKSLVSRASWVVERFGEITDAELEDFMTENVGRWGAEFERLTALRDLELG